MINCAVIQDLLPLYHDRVASEESNAIVEAHISSCAKCQAVWKAMQTKNLPAKVEINNIEIGAFQKMKKKLRKKNLVVALVSTLATIILIYGVFFLPIAIPYNAEKITAHLAEDTVIDIYYDGNYAGVTACAVGDTLYLGYYGTVFTTLWSPNERMHVGIGNNLAVDTSKGSLVFPVNEQINKVFYVNFRQVESDNNEFAVLAEDAVIIWER